MSAEENSDDVLGGTSDSLSSFLLVAAKKGRCGAVRALLKSRADHSVEDCNGNTPLLLSVANGDTKSVKLLLRSGASLHKCNHLGEGVLHTAFSNGHFELGKNLIQQGASQSTLTRDGLDWKAFATKAGHDIEAVQAALDLNLQVDWLETKSADRLSASTTKQTNTSTASSYLRELAIGIFTPQPCMARRKKQENTIHGLSKGWAMEQTSFLLDGVIDSDVIPDNSSRVRVEDKCSFGMFNCVDTSQIEAIPRSCEVANSKSKLQPSPDFVNLSEMVHEVEVGDNEAEAGDSCNLDAQNFLHSIKANKELHVLQVTCEGKQNPDSTLDNGLPDIIAAAKDLGIVDGPSMGFNDLLVEAEAFFAEIDHQSIADHSDYLQEFINRSHTSPSPPNLPPIKNSDPLRLALADRSSLFDSSRSASCKAAPWRILRGFAVLVVSSGCGKGGPLGMASQFAIDAERMAPFLDRVGFNEVQVLRDLTRQQLLEYIDQLAIALRPGGNIDEHDGILIYLAGSGGSFTIDCVTDPGKLSPLLHDRPVHVEEILGRLRGVLVGRPKIVFAQICCDPQERACLNVQQNVEQVSCLQSMFEDLLVDSPEVMIVWCSTSGHVHWIPKAGSLVINFLMENLANRAHDLDFCSIIDLTSSRLLDHFIDRQGLGSAECPVGRQAYNNFFLQKLIAFKNFKMPIVALGPSIVFTRDKTDPLFSLSMADSCVSKSESSIEIAPVHAVAQLPQTVTFAGHNIAWEFLIHNVEGSDDLVVGIAQNLEESLQKVGPVHSHSPDRVSPSNFPGQNRKSKSSLNPFENVEDIQSNTRLGVDVGWGISASGVLYPGQRIHNCGFGKMDVVECWIDKSNMTIEFTVNHVHVGHKFQGLNQTEIFPIVDLSACVVLSWDGSGLGDSQHLMELTQRKVSQWGAVN